MENENLRADSVAPPLADAVRPAQAIEEGPKPVRLPGRPSWQSASNYQLWLVGDELVHVQCPQFTESYTRIALGDVQAMTIHKTATGRLVNLFLGLALAVSLLVLAANPDSFGVWGFFGALAIGCFVLGVLNTVQGPTCECHLRTAVKSHRIAALGRWRSTQRTVDEIKALVDRVQGAVDVDDLLVSGTSDLADRLRQAPQAAQHATEIGAEPLGASMSAGRAPAHVAVFSMFLAGVPICLMDLYLVGVLDDSVSFFMNFVWFVATIGLSCFAVVQQRRMPLTDGIKSLTWAGLVYLAVLMFVLFAGGLAAGFEELASTGEGPRVFMSGSTSHVVLNVVAIIVNTIIGLGGLVLLHVWQRSHEAIMPMFEEGLVADEPVMPVGEVESFEEHE